MTETNRPSLPLYDTVFGSLLYDIKLVFAIFRLLPGLFFPLRPFRSAELDELFPSSANLRDILLHFLFTIFQLTFLIHFFFRVDGNELFFINYVATFIWKNQTLCMLTLNGRSPFLASNVDMSKFPRHDNERWIFINGIGVGHHWLQSNVNLLAKTFGREILGVHNPSNGILFDLIQCLIRRNFLYRTQDTRNGYTLIKQALKDPRYDKVVLILHSQGGIQGSLTLNKVVSELIKEDVNKLEVYTFASAANRFINQTRAEFYGGSIGRPIRHIEHYANSEDFVSQLGVLNFAKVPGGRFVGKLFERPGSGHMFNQHYLDTMFPLDTETGLVADTNDFMAMLVPDEMTVLGGQNVPGDSGSSASVTRRPISELSRLWKYRNGGSPTI